MAEGADQDGPRSPTIVDVAERAGVAIGTVSRYLNGHSIRRANRDQIEAAIAELGYRRNAVAAAMKTDRTQMVGLVVPGFDAFHAPMLEHLALSIRRTGRALLTYCHSNDPKIFKEALAFFETQRVDALIMDGGAVAYDQIDYIAGLAIPTIFYNNEVRGIQADRIAVDNRNASYRAVSHLIDLGHRRIAALTGAMQDSTAQQRLEGYEAALRDRGLPVEPAYMMRGDWGSDYGYVATQAVMALPEPPTAMFTSNYQIAFGAMSWLREKGSRIPDDLSLVSFDDVPLFRLHEAGITAVAQPLARIAESITDLLVLRLAEPHDGLGRTITLDCDLILRGSTRSIR